MSSSQALSIEEIAADARLAGAGRRVCEMVRQAGGRAYLVGGSVRDGLLGRKATDLDIEVFGIEPDELESLLRKRFSLDLVGRSFGVLKLRGLAIDVSLPRRESKTGLGHRAFEIASDPWMDVSEAQSRRDFTINAIYLDPITGELEDHFGGRRDLEAGVLRHTSDKFAEDPLRVLRGMQFIARFGLTPAPETVELCKTIEPEGLAPERIGQEWRKLVLEGVRPSLGLAFLRQTGWLKYFPELEALVGVPQDPTYHPEGDVWTHTCLCMDAFARERIGDRREDEIIGFAVLCHDLGKATTTTDEPGSPIRSRGHAAAGVAPTKRLLSRLKRPREVIEAVLPLVQYHMAPVELHKQSAGSAAVRRLARKVGRIDRLVRVARADALGRGPGSPPNGRFEPGDWLLERARSLGVAEKKPEPLVMGRHLVELGARPGPHFRQLLDACYEAQLDGRFDSLEDGLKLARELLAEHHIK